MRPPVPFLLVAGVVTAVVVGGGVVALGRDDEPTPAKESFTTTPLSDYDATGVVVTRAAFCDAIDERQVSAALGGEPADSSSWENGDPIDIGNGVEDVAHEFGCRYSAADGTMAQAWVFAPPVDADRRRAPGEGRRQGGRLRGRHRTGLRLPDAGADLHQGRVSCGRRTAACSVTPGWPARSRGRPGPTGAWSTGPAGGASASLEAAG